MTSQLTRARQTYERAQLAITAEITDDLLEWDYGNSAEFVEFVFVGDDQVHV